MPRLTLIYSAALLTMGCAAEAEEQAAPVIEQTGRVVDLADILSPDFEEELTAKLAQLETDTRVQLVVVTTPNLQGQDISDYTLELANNWGIGSAERDDGLLFVIAPNERQVRIEVGYGLEASVRDEDAGQILRETVLPQFRAGEYEAGIDAGVGRLIDEVTPYEMKEAA